MELKGLKINFFGDSITQGVGTSAPENVYHAVLKREAGLSEARNYGVSGTRFAKQTGKGVEGKESYTAAGDYTDNNAFVDRMDAMDDDADVVVVFGGTNDYGHGNAPLGEMSDRTPYTFYGACHHIFSTLAVKYLGKPVIIMTPIHRESEGVKTEPESFVGKNITFKTYVDIIREVAEFYSLPVLDLFATSGLQPQVREIKEKYVPDGLHPSDEGNLVIARKLKSFLEAM